MLDSKIQEIENIRTSCNKHIQDMIQAGYRTEASKLSMELSAIDVDLRRAEDILVKAYLKVDKIRTKWQII